MVFRACSKVTEVSIDAGNAIYRFWQGLAKRSKWLTIRPAFPVAETLWRRPIVRSCWSHR